VGSDAIKDITTAGAVGCGILVSWIPVSCVSASGAQSGPMYCESTSCAAVALSTDMVFSSGVVMYVPFEDLIR
jgi:hypothetical protein